MDAAGSRSFPTLAERLAAGAAAAETEARPEPLVLAEDEPLGGLDALRRRLDEAPGADVVVAAAGREPDAAALRRLAAAANADPICASVSELGGEPPEQPRVPPPAIGSPAWGLVYVRRDALELALDNARATGAAPAGLLRETLADILAGPGFVHRGTVRLPPAGGGREDAGRITVLVDVRLLADPLSGTQVQALGLLGALARVGELDVTALAPRRVHPSAVELVEPLRARVRFAAAEEVEPADVLHRPHQVGSLAELVECLSLGRRFVLTHQDSIAVRSPAYFDSAPAWEDAVRTTRAALAAADHVGFFSEHAALDAVSEGVLAPERATVVPLGLDHVRADGPAERPAQLSPLAGRPFLLVLGTAFRHKNRVFALRVLRELVVERGWSGGLVLAGQDAPAGSSLAEERRLLEREPALRERVVVLAHVSEREKRALYRDAALVLFPSLYEGFGLVPFEAAAFGTPCLYARRGSVAEHLPAAGALPADFSAPAAASSVLALLETPGAAEGLVAEIRGRAAALTWDATAAGYLEVYRRALARPARPLDREALAGAGVGLSAGERAFVEVYRRRRAFRTLVDGVVRTGAVATRAARRARRPV